MIDDKLSLQLIQSLSETIDAKDRYTSGHSRRVAKYAAMIAEAMDKDSDTQQQIYLAALLHDIGKIRIPVEILNKPGKLTDEEFQLIRLHTISGYHIVSNITAAPEFALAAKYHHERYDGRGYPDGLSGEDIPEVARIIGVADSYDAMASNRSYRSALPQEVVRSEIEKGISTQFAPAPAKAMLDIIGSDTDYKLRQAELQPKRIMVIDHEVGQLRALAKILKEEPLYRIFPAETGQEALDVMNDISMDLVLLNLEMTDMDSFELLHRIKNKWDIPVVFLCKNKSIRTIRTIKEAGATDYLTKPFLPLELMEVLQGVILKQG